MVKTLSETGLPAVWRMRDGREVEIIKMSTSHIKNTIAMLRRKGRISIAVGMNIRNKKGKPFKLLKVGKAPHEV